MRSRRQGKKNIITSLFLNPEELENSVLTRYEKYKKIDENEVRCEQFMTEDADIVVVAYGITSRICKSAVTAARAKGIKVGMLRPITLSPFPNKELAALAETASKFLTVELNMGQMITDVKLAIECSRPVEFLGRTGGSLVSVEDVLAKIEEMGGNK